MATINEELERLKKEIEWLKSKVRDLSRNTEENYISPYSKSGGIPSRSSIRPVDISTGLGETYGGNMIWNDSELILPPYGDQPAEPTRGYNKHNHSQFSGGALDVNTFQLVEYLTNEEGEILSEEGHVLNRHCQNFWKEKAQIKEDSGVQKIGTLEIEFDPSTRKWIAGGGFIDVEYTYLVQYIWKDGGGNEVPKGTEGAIKEVKLDENGHEMKSPLLVRDLNGNIDTFKSNVVWDKDAQCWRFYAVFRKWEEEEE